MGIPDEPFWAPAELVDAYRSHRRRARRQPSSSNGRSARLRPSHRRGRVGRLLGRDRHRRLGVERCRRSSRARSIATRVAIEKAFNAIARRRARPVAGAADLTGNTGTKLTGQEPQSFEHPGGRQMYYGDPRARDGLDDGRHGHARRRAARRRHLLRLPRLHAPGGAPRRAQPRQGRLRVHPRLRRRRRGRPDAPARRAARHAAGDPAPAGHPPGRRQRDGRRVEGVRSTTTARPRWCSAARRSRCAPTARRSSPARRSSAAPTDPQVVLVGTGSEVSLCVDAAEQLAADGIRANVVSMPSWDRFAAQTAELPGRRAARRASRCCRSRPATTFGWERYADDSIGIDRFGASAPGECRARQAWASTSTTSSAAATRLG